METDEAKRLYRARAGLCEWTNAQLAGRFGLLYAITSNLTQHLTTLAG